MTDQDRLIVMMGSWEPDPKYRIAFDLWREYYERTESFDRTVCAHRFLTGTAIPVSREEIGACTRHARAVLTDVRLQLNAAAIPDDISKSAQAEACRRTAP